MSIQWIPALRCEDEDDLGTVVAVGDPPDSIGIQQGRDYVQLSESEARKLLEWLGRALTRPSATKGE
jgi:hypothetical protein